MHIPEMIDTDLQIIPDIQEVSLHDIREAQRAVCVTRITGPIFLDTLIS